MKKTVFLTMVLVAMLMLVVYAPAFAEAMPGAATTPVIDLTGIINAIIALIGAVLTCKVVPYLREKMTDAQFERGKAMVRIAVYAAEEIYKSGHGAEKLKYVQTYLRGKGYDVDPEEIKAAVKEMRDRENEFAEGFDVSDEEDDEE